MESSMIREAPRRDPLGRRRRIQPGEVSWIMKANFGNLFLRPLRALMESRVPEDERTHAASEINALASELPYNVMEMLAAQLMKRFRVFRGFREPSALLDLSGDDYSLVGWLSGYMKNRPRVIRHRDDFTEGDLVLIAMFCLPPGPEFGRLLEECLPDDVQYDVSPIAGAVISPFRGLVQKIDHASGESFQVISLLDMSIFLDNAS